MRGFHPLSVLVGILGCALACGPSATAPTDGGGTADGDTTAETAAGPGHDGTSLASGSTGGSPDPSTGTDADSSTGGEPSCEDELFQCLQIYEDGACSDVALGSQCIDGRQQCLRGWAPMRECKCFVFTEPLHCFVGEPGDCSDEQQESVCSGAPTNSGWSCPEGTTPADLCDEGTSSGGAESTGGESSTSGG